MKVHAVPPGSGDPERLAGLVACHDVRDREGALLARKGERLDAAAAGRLAAAASEVHLLEPELDDLHEQPAGERLARASAGDGIRVQGAAGGQWSLLAERRGLLVVRVGALAAVNALEGISVYTLYDGQVVDGGEAVARAKVTPLVIAGAVVREAESAARRAGGLVTVRAFRALPVAAVAAGGLGERARIRFARVLREKLAWLGAPLVGLEFPGADPDATTAAMRAALGRGAAIVVAAGANALDPLDPVLVAIERLGGRFLRRGVPAHPGSLTWLARLGRVPCLGLPSCGMFSEGTLFDLLLPRLLAGDTLEAPDLAAYGHGGMLGRQLAFRFPPYRLDQQRGSVGD